MPELPEVEGARRLTERAAVGKRVLEAIVADDTKVICDIEPKDLEKALTGRTLLAAKRRGKQMWWEFDSGPSLLVHFGMTGGLVVQGVGAAHYKSFSLDDAAWPPRFVKFELRFDDGTRLAFCDGRRFAKVRFLEQPERVPPISELGWDPVLDMPPLADFAAALGKQRRVIKALLLDQSFSAGVGNWVADEVLFQARVHPEQPANTIAEDKVSALHAAIEGVCRLACEVEADSDRFPDDWLFHYRWGKGSGSAAKVAGRAIDFITVGGRTSAYVPTLQKLDKAAIAAAAAAKAAGGKAGGTRGKKAATAPAQDEAGAEADAVAEVVAVTAAAAGEGAAAVAVAAVAKRRGRPKKAAAASGQEDKPGAAADGSDVDLAPKTVARRAGRKKASSLPRDEAAEVSATEAAANGHGVKSFRGAKKQPAAAPEDEQPAEDVPARGGRKRKAALAPPVEAAAVTARRGRNK